MPWITTACVLAAGKLSYLRQMGGWVGDYHHCRVHSCLVAAPRGIVYHPLPRAETSVCYSMRPRAQSNSWYTPLKATWYWHHHHAGSSLAEWNVDPKNFAIECCHRHNIKTTWPQAFLNIWSHVENYPNPCPYTCCIQKSPNYSCTHFHNPINTDHLPYNW